MVSVILSTKYMGVFKLKYFGVFKQPSILDIFFHLANIAYKIYTLLKIYFNLYVIFSYKFDYNLFYITGHIT